MVLVIASDAWKGEEATWSKIVAAGSKIRIFSSFLGRYSNAQQRKSPLWSLTQIYGFSWLINSPKLWGEMRLLEGLIYLFHNSFPSTSRWELNEAFPKVACVCERSCLGAPACAPSPFLPLDYGSFQGCIAHKVCSPNFVHRYVLLCKGETNFPCLYPVKLNDFLKVLLPSELEKRTSLHMVESFSPWCCIDLRTFFFFHLWY